MIYLKQSTAVDVMLGVFVDDTDGKTTEELLTLAQADLHLSKNCGAAAEKNSVATGTHLYGGNYKIPLDATDTGTLGRLDLMCKESGALPIKASFMVVPSHIYDSLVLGTDKLEVDAVQLSNDAQSLLDLKDFADAGYDPTSNKVAGVALVDTTTANSDMRGTDSAALATTALTNATWTDARAGALTDWINGGRLDLILDIIAADTTTDIPVLINGLHSTAHCATSGTINIGSTVSGSYSDTCLDDSNKWSITHTGGASDIDFELGFGIGEGRTTTNVIFEIETTTSAGTLTFYGYNYLTASWDKLNYSTVNNPGVTGGRYGFALLQDHSTSAGAAIIRIVSTGHSVGSALLLFFCNVRSIDGSLVANGAQLSAQGKLDVNTECDTALSDYGANTTTPPTVGEVRTEMEGVGTKLTAVKDKTDNLPASPAPASEYDTEMGYIPSDLGDVATVTQDNTAHGSGSWATATSVTVSDKTGFSLSTAGIKAIWDQLTSALTTVGSMGKLLVDNINATISSRNATTPPTVGEIRTEMEGVGTKVTLTLEDTDELQGNQANWATATSVTVSDKTGFSLSTAGVDAILDENIEGTHTMREILRLLTAAMVGKSSGGGTATITFRDIDDTKNRIVATVTAEGNRDVVVLTED